MAGLLGAEGWGRAGGWGFWPWGPGADGCGLAHECVHESEISRIHESSSVLCGGMGELRLLFVLSAVCVAFVHVRERPAGEEAKPIPNGLANRCREGRGGYPSSMDKGKRE